MGQREAGTFIPACTDIAAAEFEQTKRLKNILYYTLAEIPIKFRMYYDLPLSNQIIDLVSPYHIDLTNL